MPTKWVYLTDGRSRIVEVGNRKIILKHTTPRNMATAGRISGLVIQALRHLGQAQVSEETLNQLAQRLDRKAHDQLQEDIRYAPAWIAVIFRGLAQKKESAS